METITSCPICGTPNTRTYWSEENWLVEEYYYCNTCGYFLEMCYSPAYDGIEILPFPLCIKQFVVLFKNRKKLRGLKISRPHM